MTGGSTENRSNQLRDGEGRTQKTQLEDMVRREGERVIEVMVFFQRRLSDMFLFSVVKVFMDKCLADEFGAQLHFDVFFCDLVSSHIRALIGVNPRAAPKEVLVLSFANKSTGLCALIVGAHIKQN